MGAGKFRSYLLPTVMVSRPAQHAALTDGERTTRSGRWSIWFRVFPAFEERLGLIDDGLNHVRDESERRTSCEMV